MSNSIRKIFLKLRKDERGATLVEYGVALLVAIIAGGTFLTTLADNTNSNYSDAGVAITQR
ncbi:Flp family type IVb pilin [Ruegeria sp. HKCCA5491]|uniref:Flp family type IVb pilin n=1 Tax=Ruegeria sp. HKCCA5491 TaxID=2682986 RepID=UPI0015839F37|nr:Flp family type IVb pilin [Ruegeria sp. HKCCA5491]